ncbi:MAG: VCBS repeat-containing protein [Myxococcaceae bacterium]|nr:VCBS repeat-containing protein [Myxococcaceae bacterium]
MITSRVVVVALLLSSAFLSCTPPVRRCSAATCASGCCDANGECQSGQTIAACGSGGLDCRTCATGQTCQSNVCTSGSAGGGAATGGGAAGGTGGGVTGGGVGGGTGGGMVSCSAGLTLCSGACVNTRSDFGHCGACGRSCGPGQYCDNSACRAVPTMCTQTPGSCPPNYYCGSGSTCVFGCQNNTHCAGGQICDTMRNTCTCPANANFCGGSCVPANTITACGPSCLNCASVPNSIPACTNGACTFSCMPGYHLCGNQCVSNFDAMTCGTRCTACPGAPNAMPVCDGNDCSLQCAPGFHQCGNDCVSDFDVATCGNRCQPCVIPANAVAQCMSPGAGQPPACTWQCNPGFARCGNQCLAESATSCGASCQTCTPPAGATNPQCVNGQCQYTCAAGFHQCGSQCVSDTALTSCGSSCTACPTPVNGTATCNGVACGIQCNTGFHECNGQCVSNFTTATCGARCAPCPDGPMGSGTTTTCDGVNCGLRCASVTTPNYCNNVCVADSITSCGPSCLTCTPPANATAACVSGTCDFTCNSGFHRCGTQCVADNSPDGCGTLCTPCPAGPANSVRTCARSSPTAPFACGWDCAMGTNRCPMGGNQCVPADYVLGCGPTCAVCSSANPNERGICGMNGICSTGCVTQCGGTCVNVQTNGTHCGACNTACTGAERCSQGECRAFCASGVAFRTMLPVITANTSSSFPMVVVDVNGDGRVDLVSTESSVLYVRFGQASGGFSPSTSTSVSLSITPTFLVAGDLTGDGRPEIVAIGSSSTASVLRNSGAGVFSQFTVTANPIGVITPSSVTIGEFTGAAPGDVLFGFNTSTASQAAILFPGVAASSGSPVGAGTSANIGISLISNLRAVNVNGDAHSDVVATAATNAVYLFPGTGVIATPFNTGAAALAQLPSGETFTSGASAFPLEVGDVTGDGVADAVVASTVGGGTFQVRVYPLTAAAQFGTSVALALPTAARVISLGDVNADARLDVGVGATDLRLFLAQGGGLFSAPAAIGVAVTSTALQSLVLADLTQDGRADLTSQSGSTIVTVPNEAGTFPALQGMSVPNADRVVTGDLNGDGIGDAVVTPSPGATMNAEVFFGTAAGSFTAGPTFPVRSDRIAIARLNGDSAFDLVTIGLAADAGVIDAGVFPPGNPNVRLADSSSTGSSITGRLEVFNGTTWGTVCDDNWEPPSTTSTNNGSVACRTLGFNPIGAIVAQYPSPLPGTLPIVMDNVSCTGSESSLFGCSYITSHNCSHPEDVVLTCSTVGSVGLLPTVIEVRLGSTSGTFAAPLQLATPTPATLVATGDLDADGNVDVLASTNATLHWFRNLGSGAFSTEQPIGPVGASSLVVADVNNDGRPDVLAVSLSFTTLTPYINVGGGFVAGTTVSLSGATGTNVVAADLNNDSKIDFVIGGRLYRGDGSGGFGFQASLPALPARTVLADLDNDSAPDLSAGGSGSSVLSVLRGDTLAASNFTTSALNFSAGAPIADVASIRLNTDAQRDLVVLQGVPGARFLVALPGVCR